MYQPSLRPEHIKALYYLKLKLKRPMTVLIREAVDGYLQEHGGIEEIIPKEDRATLRKQRSYRPSRGLRTPCPHRFKTWV